MQAEQLDWVDQITGRDGIDISEEQSTGELDTTTTFGFFSLLSLL